MRQELAERFIRGEGIEIGALQKPLRVPEGALVQYVDRLTREEARREYAELGDVDLVDPHIITDAQRLSGIPDGRYDFVIANHILEHMKNPLEALGNWLRVLRVGGVLYLAVPDHTNGLDLHRAVTPFQHLEACLHENGCDLDEHYSDYARSVFRDRPELWASMTEYYRSRDYAIHFHTFDAGTFGDVLRWVAQRGCRLEESHFIPASAAEAEPEHVAIIVRTA